MKILRKKLLFDLYELSVFVLPALIALILSQMISIHVYQHKQFEEGALFGYWRVLQLIPAFIYAYISDRHYRKGALVLSQAIGSFIGLAFNIFNLPFWGLLAIGFTFNPISVARAALIDNFPHYSSLKLIAITYIVLVLPWVFYDSFKEIPQDFFFLMICSLLFLNTFLTLFLFRDRADRTKETHSLTHMIPKSHRINVLLMLLGFVLSHSSMETLGSYVRQGQHTNLWMNLTNWGFLFGFVTAILYKRLPHMSMLTLTYTIGVGVSFIAILGQTFGLFGCETAVFNSMSYFSTIAGIYFPFVTDGIMSLFQVRRKAIASAVVELGHSIAVVIAFLAIEFITDNLCGLLILMNGLFLLAAILQRQVERRPVKT